MGDNHTTLNNESQLDAIYGKCHIDINVNISGSTYHYDSDCVNGFQYGIPKDRTTVTEVCILKLNITNIIIQIIIFYFDYEVVPETRLVY